MENPDKKKLKDRMPVRNGGISTIPRKVVEAYTNRKLAEGQHGHDNNHSLIRPVYMFKEAIETDPVLKMYFVGALDGIPEGGVLHGKKPNQVLHTLSKICMSPPKYEDASLNGVPIYALFIDFLDTKFGQAFFGHPTTNLHLKHIFNAYQIMLTSKVSLKYLTEEPDGWFCEQAQKKAEYDDYKLDKSKPHWGFKNWNEWFTRELKETARVVCQTPKSVVHSSDSYPLIYRRKQDGQNPTRNVKGQAKFWLKDNRYSLHDMLGTEQLHVTKLVDEHFVRGTVYQAYLDPWCYHRWHAPISGTIIKSYQLGGTYYLDNPCFDHHPEDPLQHNYINSQPMLSVVSVRQVFIMEIDDGSGRLVAIIEIGMTQVSGCHPNVIEGQHLEKGEEIGFFTFGGSSYCLIFDKGFELDFNDKVFELTEEDDQGNKTVGKQKVNTLLATYK